MIYLDNAATTHVSSATIELIGRVLAKNFANPAAVYLEGMKSEEVVENARRKVAKALSVKPSRVFFTSGGTESNNIGLSGLFFPRRGWGKNIVISGYEHPSVAGYVDYLSLQYNLEVRKIAPSSCGKISPESLLDAIDDKTAIVAAMQVNNETGAIFDISPLTNEIKKKNSRTAIFCDGIQGVLKLPQSNLGNIDAYTLSGHKLGAPKGVGALYLKEGVNYHPSSIGGGQEGGIRSGTENIAYIAALGEVCDSLAYNVDDRYKYASDLREAFLECLGEAKYVINSPSDASPYILNLSFVGTKSAVLQRALDEMGVMVSSGSSCSKGNRSKTLSAMSLPLERIDSALRISFSFENTKEQCKTASECIGAAINRIIKV